MFCLLARENRSGDQSLTLFCILFSSLSPHHHRNLGSWNASYGGDGEGVREIFSFIRSVLDFGGIYCLFSIEDKSKCLLLGEKEGERTSWVSGEFQKSQKKVTYKLTAGHVDQSARNAKRKHNQAGTLRGKIHYPLYSILWTAVLLFYTMMNGFTNMFM